MKTDKYLFQITIPSVQKLVEASRKTADLWAGSFLISYILKNTLKDLAGKYSSTKFIIPHEDLIKKDIENSFTADITNIVIFTIDIQDKNQIKDVIGCIQNSFKKHLIKVLLGNNNQKNKGISEVYEKLEEKNYLTENIKNLAEFQIENSLNLIIGATKLTNYSESRKELSKYIATLKGFKFKELDKIESFELISKENNLFPDNKNYKDYMQITNEIKPALIRGAYKCSICGERFILGATEKDFTGKEFWEFLNKKYSILIEENERLCGFCLGKRFLKDTLNKTDNIPSTSDISMKFVKEIVKKNYQEEILNILDLGKDLYEDNQNITSAIKNKDISKLDGEWLMPITWENYIKQEQDENKKNILKEIKKRLEEFYKDKDFKPIYHYAVLLMDGDNMGKKISKLETEEKQKELSKYLSEFTKKVKGIVEKNHKGFLVYAGGDDVLALLPVQSALDCANEIQKEFNQDLNKKIKDKYFPNEKDLDYHFTMSAGLILAHHRLPLNYVLSEVRNAESKAKKDGKNQIHIKYIKHSYSFAETSLKWDQIETFNNLVEKAEKIPATLATQYYELVSSFDDKSYDKNLVMELATYLMKKKNLKDEIKQLLIDLTDYETTIKDFSYRIKMAKFIKSNTVKEVSHATA
ncbi:type III-B CRISPR-associated protein Cas10/Cmr2 [Hydrogenothermus marinus]|uniref:CRISPR-associated protein Cmr2 n=1 Tax=Hydrogenothermus marinus TaxID=133270 RepID=A0A3M0BR48_9AQUI|nr:type III-B CRISPR-associated protein Cas10/Cmr2 [Hydrogenothermus marinus]RMA96965.1 CRISPR-associated protein Cmr2 [Hydrogenothermus marinus]